MASFVIFRGQDFNTPSNFDVLVSTENIRLITATATTVLIRYGVTSTAAPNVGLMTITIPSDTSGGFQRALTNLILTAKTEPVDFVIAPATFTNGQTPATASSYKIAAEASMVYS
jgi:hypothetical protein